MPDPQTVTPQEAAASAATYASNASASATEAEGAATKAAASAQKIEKEAAKLEGDRRFVRVTTILEAVVSGLVLFVLIYQGYQIFRQIKIAESQLLLTQDQLSSTINTYAFSVIEKLKHDTFDLQKTVYEPGSIFDRARETNCAPLPNMDREGERALQMIIAHYELYYEAARLRLIPKKEWQTTCHGAVDLFRQYCLLQVKWDDTFKAKVNPEFAEAFIPTCELAE